jgi:hypothetical protein
MTSRSNKSKSQSWEIIMPHNLPATSDTLKRKRQQAAKKAAITRNHCKMLVEANEKLDEFDKAKFIFYKKVYMDSRGNRKAFHATVTRVQMLLRDGILPLARVNAGRDQLEKRFDRIRESTQS